MNLSAEMRVAALLPTVILACAAVAGARQGPNADARPLGAGAPVERELKADEVHAYQIELAAGEFLRATVEQRGIDVVVTVFAPDGAKLAEVDSPNGSHGPEPVSFVAKSAGAYRLEVRSLEKTAAPGRYEARVDEVLTAAEYARRLAAERAKTEAVVGWLRANAIRLSGVEAGAGFDDMRPLKRVLKDVRIVGLGEATHGTREFFQFKHRMLEFLVREMGFRVFAIEASYSACFNINDYVMGRADEGAKALDSQGFWTWNTEEVRAMLDWMRAYNAGAPEGRKVKFVGYDIQVNARGKQEVLAYLRRVAPERVADAEALFKVDVEALGAAPFRTQDKKEREDALARLAEARAKYNELLGLLVLNEEKFAARTSPADAWQAREYARVLAQYVDAYGRPFGVAGPESGGAARDYYMAENIRRLVEREPPGTRVVVWAHNGHISAGDDGGRYPRMGWHLRKAFGDAYYALGFSFNQGAFQSRDMDPKAKRALTEFKVGAAPENSLDWFLARPGIKYYVIDFRHTPKPAPVAEWHAAPHPMRSVGSGYAVGAESSSLAPVTLKQEFDGVVFFEATTRARPNPSVPNVAAGAGAK